MWIHTLQPESSMTLKIHRDWALLHIKKKSQTSVDATEFLSPRPTQEIKLWPIQTVQIAHTRRSKVSYALQHRACPRLVPARQAAEAPQGGATDDLFEGFPELLAAEGVDQRVDDGVAHDEDEVHVEVGHEADAVRALGAGDVEYQVQEEGRPADHEDPQQYGQRDRALHAGALAHGARAWQDRDPLRVESGREEHVDVERRHESQHGDEDGDEADEHGAAVRVNDEQDARRRAGRPDGADGGRHAPHRHDGMVLERVEDGEVPVHGDGQQAADGGQQGAADHRVDDVVDAHREALRVRVRAVQQGDDDGLRPVGNAHQHVSHSQAADEEVHGRVQVLVLGDGHNDQNVLQQADGPQSHEHLGRDEELLVAAPGRLAFCRGLGDVGGQSAGAAVPGVQRGVHSTGLGGVHPGFRPPPG